jgi:chemotaxis signal transduction protein
MIQEYCGVRVSRSLRLAIPTSNVEEILQLRMDEVSPMPGVASWILGAIHQKGKLVWVIHFEQFLGIKPRPLASSFLAVVIAIAEGLNETKRVACCVVGIEGILTIDDQQLWRMPDRLPNVPKKILKGVAKTTTYPHAVVDPEAFFNQLK